MDGLRRAQFSTVTARNVSIFRKNRYLQPTPMKRERKASTLCEESTNGTQKGTHEQAGE